MTANPQSKLRLEPGELEQLAIFPLPSVVLLPHGLLPLHIFEPRYRAMTKEALDRKLPIAMAMPIEGELDERGRPKIRGVAGVGKIVRHEPLPDGRSNVLLLGLGRVRIERELEVETPFRQVQATLTRSRVEDVSRLDSLLMSVRALAMAIRTVEPKVATELERMMDPAMGKEVVVDRIASVFLPNPSQRQTLLEEPVVEKRLAIVVDRLAQYLVQLRMERGGGDGLLH